MEKIKMFKKKQIYAFNIVMVNTDANPKYLTTVYNYLYEIYPKMSPK
jgi:hypothetical protein